MKAIALVLAVLLSSAAHAQFGVPWRKPPAIVVIAAEGDPRIALVDEAIAHWNRTFEEVGAGFKLPGATRADAPIPEEALREVSDAIVSGRRPIPIPQALRELPGELSIVLAHSAFISFSSPLPEGKRVIGIRGLGYPLTLPNVARNVIAHELGHAIGLGHNADPALLMCGRPAPCRPPDFTSPTPRFFPLGEAEREALRLMYPRARGAQ
ncbi:MAG TPA: hypothetical protein VFT23_18195 [Burkholderiales bacterium]|nr:hypothetical protein [Burkholderiales bacterium]